MDAYQALRPATTVAALGALCNFALAGVLTVGPSGAYPDIAAALAFAQPGDVILVEPGSYGPFEVRTPVRIVGPGSAQASIDASSSIGVRVASIASGAELWISGFTVRSNAGALPEPASIVVEKSAGGVVLHDVVVAPVNDQVSLRVFEVDRLVLSKCALLDGGAAHPTTKSAALEATDSTVWITDCLIRGGANGGGAATQGNNGIMITGGFLRMWGSAVVGGDAIAGTGGTDLLTGGHAIRATHGARLDLHGGPGSMVRGGDGAPGPLAGAGGSGMYLTASSKVAFQNAIPLVGGTGGIAPGPIAPPALLFGGSSYGVWFHAFPVLTTSTPVVAHGTSIALDIAGAPSATTHVFASFASGPTLALPGVGAVGFLDAGSAVSVGGAVLDPIDGRASLAVPVPASPALAGLVVSFQAIHVGPVEIAFSSPTFAAILR